MSVHGQFPTVYQWATAGYNGAIGSGKTICGVLFGGAIYLGFLNGKDSSDAPTLKDEGRIKAIKSVNAFFNGFINKFGETDCSLLTGCDWSKKEDIQRYYNDEIYKNTCFRQFEYVIEKCVSDKNSRYYKYLTHPSKYSIFQSAHLNHI